MGAERSRKATLGGRWQTAPWNGADCWSGQDGAERSRKATLGGRGAAAGAVKPGGRRARRQTDERRWPSFSFLVRR